jgi:N-acetyl-anhydromuramyl-L-alanine amidase AmpD
MTDYPTANSYATRLKDVRLIVLHTMEVPCTDTAARNVMIAFQNTARQASAHYGIGPGITLSGVPETGTAWATPSCNADGLQIEQAGYSGKTDGSVAGTDWTTGPGAQVVSRTATLVADLAARWNIPIRHLTNAELLAGQAGIIGHVQASAVYGGTHWDPGETYPWDTLINLATGTTTTTETDIITMATVSDLTTATRAAQTIMVSLPDNGGIWQVNLIAGTKRHIKSSVQVKFFQDLGIPYYKNQAPAVLSGLTEVGA